MARRFSDPFKSLFGVQPKSTLNLSLVRENGTLGLTCIMDTSRVTSVRAGSAAEKAGVQPFDRITAVNGEQLTGSLGSAVAAAQARGLST